MKHQLKGILRGKDARIEPNEQYQVYLRETKLYYITEGGLKYRKSDGNAPGIENPMYKLDLNSIEPRIVL